MPEQPIVNPRCPRSPGWALRRWLLGLLGFALVSACGNDGGVAGVLLVSTIEVDPPSGAVVLGQSLQLTATPKTEGGIVLPARDVVWFSTNEATATVSSDGLVQAVSIGGPVRIRATMSGVTGETQITVVPVPVDRVVLTPPSAGILVGQSTQLAATPFDASGNPLTGRSITWATGAPTIADVTTTGMVIGIAPGGPVSVTATSEGKSGAAAVTVTPRPPTRLGFLQQPGTTTAGAAITPAVRVAVQDDLLGTVTNATNAVTIALGNNPGGATLSGNQTVAAVNGVATFANLSLARAGTGYTLVATAQALTPATSAAFNLTAGAATQLAFTIAPPATAKSGVAFTASPLVQVSDPSGNPVPAPGIVITATLAPSGATLGGITAATTNASGAATFTGLMISGPVGAYTIGFAAPGLTPVGSASIALTAGNPATLSITTQPAATAQSGIPLARQPAVRLLDGAGNPVSQSGVLVSAAIASGPAGGSLGGSTTAPTNGSGIATFTNLALSGPAGSYTLHFSSTGLPVISSSAIVLSAGVGAILALTTQPSPLVANGQIFPQQPVIRLRDAAGNPVSQAGVLVSAAIQTGSGQLVGGTTVATNASGVAAFANLAITGQTGGRTLLFASAGYVSVVSGTVAVGPGAAAQLAVTSQPSASAQSGVAFPQQPVIQLQDGSGNPVSQAGTSITASLASGPAGGSLGGSTTASTNGSGIATFTNLALSGPAGSYTLRFSSTGLPVVSSSAIVLSAGASAILALTTQPSPLVANGQIFPQQPVIRLRDAAGNPVGQAGVLVSASIQTGGGQLVGGTTVATDASGVAAFANLAITGQTGGRTLLFASAGYVSVVSGTVAVGPGAAAKLAVTSQPSASAQSGVAFPQQPVIQLQDGSGNPVSQAGTSITASLASGPAGGSLGGSTVATTNASGAAAFTGLMIGGPVGAYTITFAGTALSGAASNPVTLGTGAGTNLALATQPSSAAVNAAVFPQQPVVQLVDGSGNPISQAGVPVSVGSSGGGGTLGGVSTVNTDASGRAAFSGLSITGKAGNYTLAFSAPGLAGITSATIALGPGPAVQLTITTQPSAVATSAVPFAQQPVLQVQDVSGNAVSGALVTAAIASGGGSLGGSATAPSDANGVAAFSGLSITGLAGAHTLSFTAPGVSPVASSSIALSAVPASQLIIATQPSSTAQSGVPFPQQPVVQVVDVSGHPVSGVVVSAAIASGGGALGGTNTATSNASGIAAFPNLSISGTIGARTLSFTASGIPAATSNAINLTAGPATQLVIVQQPSSSTKDDNPFARQPIVQLRDAAGNGVSGASVTAAINSAFGNGRLRGTLTIITDATGLATFTDLEISRSGFYTLRFTSGGLTVVSSVITVN